MSSDDTVIQVPHAKVKLAIIAWLASKGTSVPADALMVIDAQGNVTIDLDTAIEVMPVLPVPVPPITPPLAPTAPAAPKSLDPGAPFSLHCIATCFGYQDPGDKGIGAWGHDNNNPTTVGGTVPIPILEATLGGVHASLVQGYTVSVICLDSGKSALNVDITDDGPGASVDGKHGLLVGKDGVLHAFDMTCGLCKVL